MPDSSLILLTFLLYVRFFASSASSLVSLNWAGLSIRKTRRKHHPRKGCTVTEGEFELWGASQKPVYCSVDFHLDMSDHERTSEVPRFRYDQLTDEQRAVVDAVAGNKQNAVVNAVAGSGKTRTAITTGIEWLQNPITKGKVLLVAYNKRLQQDMTDQRDASAPPIAKSRIEIRTIHGLGHYYFGGSGLTSDRELIRWTKSKAEPTNSLPNYGLVVIDEAQDLTPQLFDFLHYFLSLLDRPQILLLGDPFQLLYRFRGADESYLFDAEEKFASVAKAVPFEKFKLSICFRITHEMADWINANLNPNNLCRAKAPDGGWFDRHREEIAIWWKDGIRANPNRGPEPESVYYFKRTRYKGRMLLSVVEEIEHLFSEFDMDSSALLAPSIVRKENSPVRLITNTLTHVYGVQQSWYHDCGMDLEETGDIEVRRNKRIASTIHRFKGRERDAIVLVGFDAFAEKVEKDDPRNVFNMFYVGATRARKKLLIIQWSDEAYATHPSRITSLADDDNQVPYCLISKALEYCPYNDLLCEESRSCTTSKTITKISPKPLTRKHYVVNGAHYSKRRRTLENVSSVLGVAIEVKLQLLLDNGRLRVPQVIFCAEDNDEMLPQSLIGFMNRLRAEARRRTSFSWPEILRIATAQLTLNDRMYYRWRQVQEFESWLVAKQSAHLDGIVENLVHLLYVPFCCGTESDAAGTESGKDVSFEKKLEELKKLRRDGRLLLQQDVRFNMEKNPEFVRRWGIEFLGILEIVLISENAALRRRQLATERAQKAKAQNLVQDIAEVSSALSVGTGEFITQVVADECEQIEVERGEISGANDEGNTIDEQSLSVLDDGETIIVHVTVASKMTHDDLLKVACYGAMWHEKLPASLSQVSQASASSRGNSERGEAIAAVASLEKEKQMPKMLVAHPNLGVLREALLHMNCFEFLHRIGFRKMNKPFQQYILNDTHGNVVNSPERNGPSRLDREDL